MTSQVQLRHYRFGGELKDPEGTTFRDVSKIDIVGMFPDYASAYNAWKSASQRTVDNAHTRYFIAHIHRLREEEREDSNVLEMAH